MVKMVFDRKTLNKGQTQLRKLMMAFDQHEKAIELFMSQHASLHSAQMAQAGLWSYEDEILDEMTTESIRRIPTGYDHSVAWCIWHIARIEDVAMNLLVAGTWQILNRDNWLDQLKIPVEDTGNAMDEEGVVKLSNEIDIDALRGYRMAVGRRTREIVLELAPGMLRTKIDPSRLQRVRDEGAVVAAASGVIDYWSRRNIA